MLLQNYDLITNDFATFIHLDISNGGLRKTDSSQWLNLPLDIKDSEHKNIFIVINDSIDEFEDIEERKFFVDLLCDLKRETKKNNKFLHHSNTQINIHLTNNYYLFS